MTKKKLLRLVLIVVLALLVPYLIGRVTAAILEATYMPSEKSVAGNHDLRPGTFKERLDQIQAEAEVAKRGLARARTITRITLVVIGIYYVVLISGWIILRRRKRKLLPA